ncbi:hypothetical protein BSKO_12756 [Bryopsis sp. KO-2023]|nr:hypothetical protein BSKO_12756 [Bryopsis sp. KO-2023]
MEDVWAVKNDLGKIQSLFETVENLSTAQSRKQKRMDTTSSGRFTKQLQGTTSFDLDNLLQENASLRKQKDKSKNDALLLFEELKCSKAQMASERNGLKRTIQSLQSKIKEAIVAKESLNAKLTEKDATCREAQAELQVLKGQFEKLQVKSGDGEIKIASLEDQLSQMRKELEKMREKKPISKQMDSSSGPNSPTDPSKQLKVKRELARALKNLTWGGKEANKICQETPNEARVQSKPSGKQSQYLVDSPPVQRMKLLFGQPSKKNAVVVLVMKGDAYSLGACLVASRSKVLNTKADLVCMVTADISKDAKNCLCEVFDVIYEVPYLEYECDIQGLSDFEPFRKLLFTKWNALGLIAYSKVLLVDADFLPIVSFDDLFKLRPPAATFAPPCSDDRGWLDPYVGLSHGSRVQSSMINKAITCALSSDKSNRSSFLALGSLVLLEPGTDTLMSLKGFISSRQPFGVPGLHSGFDEQAIVLFFNSHLPHKPWSHIAKAWNCVGSDSQGLKGSEPKAYHYRRYKPWSMSPTKETTSDLEMWYSAAADLLRTKPATAPLFGKCLGPNFMQVFEQLESRDRRDPKKSSPQPNSTKTKPPKSDTNFRFNSGPGPLATTTTTRSQSQNNPSMPDSPKRSTITKKQDKPSKRRKMGSAYSCLSKFLLTQDELEAYGFPTHNIDIMGQKICPRGFVETTGRRKGGRMVAVDCEMCETVEGSELTRMSLVDEDGEVLVDVFVRPTNPITNYWTEYSGVTERILQNVTTSLKDAQAMFLHHVSADTILVGHSLDNDVRAIKVIHSKILDTVVLYPHPRGFPSRSSLKFLAQKYLGKCIQDGCHDSTVDASVALKLVKMKVNQDVLGSPSSPNFS